MTAVNQEKMHAFAGKMLGDLGGAFAVPTARIGFRLGLYAALAEKGPMGAEALAAACSCKGVRLVREWALAQAANGYIDYDPETERFSVNAEQAAVFVLRDSPLYLEGAFDLAAAMIEGEAKVERAFRDGGGVRWGDTAGCLFCATGAFFRPGYVNNLVQNWLPALDGVVERLKAGAKVADIGCGVGFSTLLMARAYPESRFVGFDFHAPSIDEARRHAEAEGLGARASFEVAAVKDIAGGGFDFATVFDCLHDMGDPEGAAAAIRGLLKPDGVCMVVEPIAGARPADNMNPVGRLYYNASTMVCVPTSLDQEVGRALGAQAGEAALAAALRKGGFRSVRRATEGPFNMVLEARV